MVDKKQKEDWNKLCQNQIEMVNNILVSTDNLMEEHSKLKLRRSKLTDDIEDKQTRLQSVQDEIDQIKKELNNGELESGYLTSPITSEYSDDDGDTDR